MATTKYDWNALNPHQVGRYAEYYVKMEFTLHGFDVYTAEVDDKGVDFVVRRGPDTFLDVQVKSLRSHGYVFAQKSKFDISRDTLALALVLFKQGQLPDVYLIPAGRWLERDGVFVSRTYGAPLKSKPEYGINVSKKNLAALQPYLLDNAVVTY